MRVWRHFTEKHRWRNWVGTWYYTAKTAEHCTPVACDLNVEKKNMWVVYRSEIRASHHIHAKNDNSCPATSYTNFRFQLKSYWHTMIFNCSRLESPDVRRGVCDQNSLINKSTSMKKLMSKRRFKTIKPNSDCFPWRLSKFKSCINGIYFSI